MTSKRVVGRDPAFKAALTLARRAASGSSPVILVGPTGCGKSHFARFIHESRPNPEAPFREWNAGGVPAPLFEAELFGVERGTATGVASRPGLFETIGEGTLCLTGIELLPSAKQAALLRVLEERAYSRLGGSKTLRMRAFILAAFSETPERLAARDALRKDLFYRLDVIRITLPSLGERQGDVPLLADAFLKLACKKMKRPVPILSDELGRVLREAPWPGNLRELSTCMEGLALTGGDVLEPGDLPASFWVSDSPVQDGLRRRLTLAELKDAYTRAVLAKVGGNKSQAARWLGISRKALWEYLRRGPS